MSVTTIHHPTTNIVELKNVTFGYDASHLVLNNVSFNIHEGDYLGIVGPNGGGKTTLLKLIVGLLKPTSGSISLFGQPISDFSDWKKISYVAQKSTSFDQKFPVSVYDVVAMGRYADRGVLHRLTSADRQAVLRALEQVELVDQKNKLIGTLSGGQQQRVFIARALVQDPKIIFLDEPTSGVDIASQEHFYDLLSKLNTHLGITLVLVSHDVDIIAKEVTEVACINQTLTYHGDPADFLKDEHMYALYPKSMKVINHHHSA